MQVAGGGATAGRTPEAIRRGQRSALARVCEIPERQTTHRQNPRPGAARGVVMVIAIGMACIAWTVFELVRMARQTPSLIQSRPAPRAPGAHRPRRLPLAAWDEQGRPIFVEDVSHRGPR